MIAGATCSINGDASACFNKDGIKNNASGFCSADRGTSSGAIQGQVVSGFDLGQMDQCVGALVDVGTDRDTVGISHLTTFASLPVHRDRGLAVDRCPVDPDAIGAVRSTVRFAAITVKLNRPIGLNQASPDQGDSIIGGADTINAGGEAGFPCDGDTVGADHRDVINPKTA